MLPILPRSAREELLDRRDPDPEELRENLRDLARVSRWGGARGVLTHLRPAIARWPAGRPLRVLDAGTGGGDLARALVLLCRRLRVSVRIVALDRSGPILGWARSQVADHPEIALVRGDILAPPFPPGSFDFVICTLLLHHIPPDEAGRFLRQLSALARKDVVVSDLRRGRWEYCWTFLFSRVLLRGRMTRHDAPLSVLRSLTLPEAQRLAREAGWHSVHVRRSFPLRLLLTERPPR